MYRWKCEMEETIVVTVNCGSIYGAPKGEIEDIDHLDAAGIMLDGELRSILI